MSDGNGGEDRLRCTNSLAEKIYKSKTITRPSRITRRLGSERLDHNEEDDRNQAHSRQLIHHSKETRRMRVSIHTESVAPSRKQDVKDGQPDDQCDLCPDPPHSPVDHARSSRQNQAETPGRYHRRHHDPTLQATFHDFECL